MPQGAKDPLQNAKGRALEMEKLCPNVEVIMVDGGHCPFDEQPDFCNHKLVTFVNSLSRIPAPPAELSAS
jgi:pimeloyl-ACP methyl ester carboxylesterase